jgi:hypothetical protein
MKTGAIVDVEMSGDLPNLFGGEYRALLMEWLVDDNGAMLNMAHVIALVPVLVDSASEDPTEAPFVPVVIIDDDGDSWTLGEDGKYRWKDALHGSIITPETRDEIKDSWGIREEW